MMKTGQTQINTFPRNYGVDLLRLTLFRVLRIDALTQKAGDALDARRHRVFDRRRTDVR